jgi:hypothetical protein
MVTFDPVVNLQQVYHADHSPRKENVCGNVWGNMWDLVCFAQ